MADTTGNPITCNCKGTGKYTVNEDRNGPFFGGFSTHLCPCRLNEPLREGKAAWWTSESVKEMEWESATKFDWMSACIDRERPVSEDNHRLYRREENRYFPVMATLDAKFGSVGLTSDMLRDLATWLTQVADEVDRIEEEELAPTQAEPLHEEGE